MRRPTLHLIVDAAAFAGFVLLTASGVLMRYVLPPGSGHSTTIWSLDRHEWGSIHFWLSIVLLAVLASHLVLHRRWIASVLRGRPREGSGARIGLGLVGLVALLALAVAPFLSPVERSSAGASPGPGSPLLEGQEAVLGSMTLREVEQATGVPAAHILRELGLPPDTDPNERLGKLRRTYGFTIGDVRRIVERYR